MKRDSSHYIETYLASDRQPFNVLIVQGARQVGKTYLIESTLQSYDHVAINFEKQPDLLLALDDTKDFASFVRRLDEYTGFKPHQKKVLYIDEAQESRTIGRYIRHFKEDWRDTKVILSGSSMQRIFREGQRVPVGRFEYLTIYPFTFREYLRFIENERFLDLFCEDLKQRKSDDHLHQTLLTHYDNYLHIGGMPEAIKASAAGQDYTRVHQLILATQRDDFMRVETIDYPLFIDAIRAVSHHVGDVSHYSHIPTTHYKAKQVIESLIKWFLVIETAQLGSIPTQKFSPKRYLYDVGIMRSYRELPVPRISLLKTINALERTPLGGVIENAVCLALLELSGGIWPLCGWKKDAKHPIEVDFIYKHKQKAVFPIEVKAALEAQNKHLTGLRAYCERHHPPVAILASLDKFQVLAKEHRSEIINIPAYGINDYLLLESPKF